jgi:hypothetical protein
MTGKTFIILIRHIVSKFKNPCGCKNRHTNDGILITSYHAVLSPVINGIGIITPGSIVEVKHEGIMEEFILPQIPLQGEGKICAKIIRDTVEIPL